VETVRLGRHGAVTIRVAGLIRAGRCTRPATRPDAHTCRALLPWYQPIRNACTWKPAAVVDT
jgi:hypothetical protein